MFHQDWWLEAVAPGAWRKLTVEQGGKVVGVLPICQTSKWGLKFLRMPPFTHILGPAVEVGLFSPIGQLHRRFKITSELLAKVPPNHFFRQALDVSVPDVFAFQAAGYAVSPHYTMLVDTSDTDRVWNGLEKKTRWVIRRSSERLEVTTLEDPQQFMNFYVRNLRSEKLSDRVDSDRFSKLHEACRQRDSGRIFAVKDADGRLLAAIFLVWGMGRLYYIMSTRDRTIPDAGAVSLLVWHSVKEAHQRSLTFDLDGIISKAVFHFLSGFGGVSKPRMVVQKQRGWLETARVARKWLLIGGGETFV
jgi:Acetyltransferase (GNAT) domain